MGRLGSSRAVTPALIAALLCAPAAPIMAQPKAGAPAPGPPAPRPPSDAQMTQAKDLVNKAITKSQQGDHQTAIELYLQAYDIAPLSLLLSNIGSEYQQANKPIEALKYFCKYLEVEPTGPNASYATAQAKVLQTSLHNAVEDGNVCKPLPAVAPPPPTDGSGSAGLGAGSAVVIVPVVRPEDPGHGMRVAGIGVGAAGVALAVVGVIFGSKAASISNSITNHPISEPWPNDIQAQESEGQSDQTKQIAFLVAGGAAVGVGVALYVIGRGKKGAAEEHALVVPTAAPGYGGVAFTGRW